MRIDERRGKRKDGRDALRAMNAPSTMSFFPPPTIMSSTWCWNFFSFFSYSSATLPLLHHVHTCMHACMYVFTPPPQPSPTQQSMHQASSLATYEGWITDGPARTSESATDCDFTIIMYTSPFRFCGTTQLPSVMGENWLPPLYF